MRMADSQIRNQTIKTQIRVEFNANAAQRGRLFYFLIFFDAHSTVYSTHNERLETGKKREIVSEARSDASPRLEYDVYWCIFEKDSGVRIEEPMRSTAGGEYGSCTHEREGGHNLMHLVDEQA